MRKLGFFLLYMFVSLPTPAEEANIWRGAPHHSQAVQLPQLDESIGGIKNWDKKNLTYKFSEKFSLALRKKGDLGGPGLEYSYSADAGIRFAIIRSPVTGKKIPVIAIGITF